MNTNFNINNYKNKLNLSLPRPIYYYQDENKEIKKKSIFKHESVKKILIKKLQ